MTGVKILGILLLLSTVFCLVSAEKLIYRRYERKHPKKNYVQVVEIFDTRRAPPHFSQNDRELNDFLARDSYSTDMNCTKGNGTVDAEAVTRPATTTTRLPTIPTTAYRRATTPSTRGPNLNDLFTIRTTKPTIKPNPRENNNPDYTNVLPWPNTNVQVTKHPPSTSKPTIMIIKETDEHPQNNQTEPKTNSEPSDDEIIYADEDSEGVEEDYNEQNYNDVIPPEQFEPTQKDNATLVYSDETYEDQDEDNEEDFDELKSRRKRHKRFRSASLRASKRRQRHNQLSENVSWTNTF